VLTAVFSLIMPKTYKSTAIIVPAQGETQLNVYEALSSNLFGLGMGGRSTDILLLMAIMDSRTLKEDIIAELDLLNVYGVSNMDEAVRTLSDHITTTITEDNTLEISFNHRTSWFAFSKNKEEPTRVFVQQVANRIVYTLDELSRTYLGQEAKSYREFIEERTKEIHQNLTELENRLTEFQEMHEVILMDAQLQATLEAAALLEAEVVKQELDHALAKAKLGPDSPMAKNLDSELLAVKTAFEKSLGGRNNEKRYLLGYDRKLPELMKEYLRLRRDISIQSEVFSFITTKYEESKLREAQDTPTIVILDSPRMPDLRSAPRRAFMVITVGIFMTVLTVILAFVLDFIRRIRLDYPEQYKNLISDQ
jgi:uncharacterized protein involved in exopolysaccharide biosynthesis